LGDKLSDDHRVVPVTVIFAALFDLNDFTGNGRFLMGDALFALENYSDGLGRFGVDVSDLGQETEIFVECPVEFDDLG